ncbi:hypothetical protein JTE90_022912 [Oedothorax gibbosus]|uniref:Uncharacterized protein n=1 Tax=Oedothorax gibbosus TaxID=931172 RepID=A0AAV6TLK3_9ARAC|nr:hypothetical protein JTE90_022912 [Oedothorax gibbosus]
MRSATVAVSKLHFKKALKLIKKELIFGEEHFFIFQGNPKKNYFRMPSSSSYLSEERKEDEKFPIDPDTICGFVCRPKWLQPLEDPPPTSLVVDLWIAAGILKGFGTLTYYAMGLSYMDDNAKKRDSPMYFTVAVVYFLSDHLWEL